MSDEMTAVPSLTTESVPLGDVDNVEFRGGNLHLSRPSTSKSAVSQNSSMVTSTYTAKNLFSFKEGAVDNAVKMCKTSVLKDDIDGILEGAWLLTQIDHWDMEKERLVLLTTKSILIVHFDFIRVAVNDFRRIMFHSITRVQIGDLVYPAISLMPPRQHGGVCIYYGNAEPSFMQRWNPMCDELGYVTLTHHLLAYQREEHATLMYDVGDFIESAIATGNKVRSGSPMNRENCPITIESYGSVMSMIYNQSHIGFNLSRGGVSF